MQLPQLRRIRWAVRAALFLGVAASIAANVLHAQQNIISQTISAWPPLALLLTVELTSRIPMHRPMLATLRVTSTAVIAGIAAWVSYWHMKEVAVRYGETSVSAYLLPISVDGLIVVASVSLVELAGRIRMLEETRGREMATATSPAVAPVQFVQPAPTAATSLPVPAFQPAAPAVSRAHPDPRRFGRHHHRRRDRALRRLRGRGTGTAECWRFGSRLRTHAALRSGQSGGGSGLRERLLPVSPAGGHPRGGLDTGPPDGHRIDCAEAAASRFRDGATRRRYRGHAAGHR